MTIVGGKPDGWTTVTDAEGRYAFEDYPYCELDSAECLSRRFRVEKAGYETRELGASDPSHFSRSGVPTYSAVEKRIPMGHAWPTDPQIQRMRRDLPAPSPLFLYENPYFEGSFAGGYGGRIIRIRNLDGSPASLHTIGHEYCHAHQHWVLNPRGGTADSADWPQSPEGLAFLAAWEADVPTNHPFLEYVELRGDRRGKSPVEESAIICSHYFYDFRPYWLYYAPLGVVGREYLRDHLPHLHAWAEEWLRHR